MKQCPTCGAEVQPEWTLCPACMSKLPSLATSPTVVPPPPPGPVAFDAAADVPETPPAWSNPSVSPGKPASSPPPQEEPPAGKPPEKRDLMKTLTHPVLLGLVGALVIFLVVGMLLPGGFSDLFGGKSVDTRTVASITPGTTPSLAANTVVPLTPMNTTVNVTAIPQTTPTTVPSVKPSQNVTANQTPHVDHTLSPYLQNGGGGDGTWKYEPTSVGTIANLQTAAPIVTWTTPVTFPIMPTPTLQVTTATPSQVYPVVTATPIQSAAVAITTVAQGGHSTGSLAWAGTGNYASDLFDLSGGVVKLSVTADQTAMVTVMDSTGKTIGFTTAGPLAGSNAIPIPATGKYLVDVSCAGTWMVTVSVLSTGTSTTVQTSVPTTTVSTQTTPTI